jgi:hypothetical protein
MKNYIGQLRHKNSISLLFFFDLLFIFNLKKKQKLRKCVAVAKDVFLFFFFLYVRIVYFWICWWWWIYISFVFSFYLFVLVSFFLFLFTYIIHIVYLSLVYSFSWPAIKEKSSKKNDIDSIGCPSEVFLFNFQFLFWEIFNDTPLTAVVDKLVMSDFVATCVPHINYSSSRYLDAIFFQSWDRKRRGDISSLSFYL